MQKKILPDLGRSIEHAAIDTDETEENEGGSERAVQEVAPWR
jgi:hypothetical protein